MSYISPSKVFAHLDRMASWRAGDKAAPVTVEIDLTNVCSLGCQSCHFSHTHLAGPWATKPRQSPEGFESTGRVADIDMLRRAFDDMAAVGVRGLVLSGGGEPTLHPKFDEILAATERFDVGMYTLGGHIASHSGRAEVIGARCQWVVVSLDCVDGDTYAAEKGVPAKRFDEACAGIRALSGQSCVVGVSFLLHRDNWMHAHAMRRVAMDLGATYVTFRPTVEPRSEDVTQLQPGREWVTDALPVIEALSDLPDVEVDPRRFREFRDWDGRAYATCYGVRMVTQITPDGRVWICPNRRGLPGSALGDLTTESFRDIWARHPGQWTDFSQCRAMCRLHMLNEVLAPVFEARHHEAFL